MKTEYIINKTIKNIFIINYINNTNIGLNQIITNLHQLKTSNCVPKPYQLKLDFQKSVQGHVKCEKYCVYVFKRGRVMAVNNPRRYRESSVKHFSKRQ